MTSLVLPRLASARFALIPLLLLTSGSAAAGTSTVWPGRGRLGVEVQPMTAELREFFKAPPGSGVLVVRIQKGRPAEAAGLQAGDVILSAGGEPLERPHDLVGVVARVPAGEKLVLEVLHAGETRTVEVMPEGEPPTADALEAWHDGRWGAKRSETAQRLEAIEKRLEAIERNLTGGGAPAPEPAPQPPAQ
jgi:membrane-associated protease RseP (regulator of RpoE activity)